jgi:hypothetical protein
MIIAILYPVAYKKDDLIRVLAPGLSSWIESGPGFRQAGMGRTFPNRPTIHPKYSWFAFASSSVLGVQVEASLGVPGGHEMRCCHTCASRRDMRDFDGPESAVYWLTKGGF